MKETISTFHPLHNNGQDLEKFWDYSNGKIVIKIGKLYGFLYKKGYRYYQTSVKDPIFVILVRDNTVNVLFANICKICLSLIDRDFSSLPVDERNKVKAALKRIEHSLTKKQLAHFKPENLSCFQDSTSKQFLMTLNKNSSGEKGGGL